MEEKKLMEEVQTETEQKTPEVQTETEQKTPEVQTETEQKAEVETVSKTEFEAAVKTHDAEVQTLKAELESVKKEFDELQQKFNSALEGKESTSQEEVYSPELGKSVKKDW